MLSEIGKKNNLRILARLLEEEASLSGLARELKITKTRAFYSLRELERLGLVRKEIKGRTHIYRFNFLQAQAKEIIKVLLLERKKEYNEKLEGLPSLVDVFLKTVLKEKYQGCLFFGSSLEGKFKDIDLFVMLQDLKQKKELEEIIKLIDKRLSPVFGTREELKRGAEAKDMLYLNIIRGLPFSCEDFVLEVRYKEYFLRRKDIEERFILGCREILSCLEFKEKEYAKKHLEKGIMEIAYAMLNYYGIYPKNDPEAKRRFKEKSGSGLPTGLKGATNLINKIRRISGENI